MRHMKLAWLAGLAAVCFFAAGVLAADMPGMVSIDTPEGEKPRTTWIKGVDFDHDLHAMVADCQTCHHMAPSSDPADIVSCRECHYDTQSNDPSSYYAAWHAPAEASCVGCHRQMGLDYSCKGACHDSPRG